MAKSLERYFGQFRKNIIGIDAEIEGIDGKKKKVVYADWTASGRCYRPIEERICEELMPFVANTHTEISSTGLTMTRAYHKAQKMIKAHVNASSEDLIITRNSGMTGLINKFQRMLGLRIHEDYRDLVKLKGNDKPVVFITHMEHHSNQTTWLETLADVHVINPTEDGLVDLKHLRELLIENIDRKLKIVSVSACSNVTGIITPYHAMAKIAHKMGAYCFVDFACSAPYVNIDMHPEDEESCLDAIFFSPHKFLGGPGSTGVMVFNKKLYHTKIPDAPGGGTVDWTNPWGEHMYLDDIEAREDGGTPAFLQTIKAAFSVKLKAEMGVDKMMQREEELIEILWEKLSSVKNIHILAKQHKKRLGLISFYIEDLNYNLGVKMLNDRFGIQTRGGCSCAGTYGHFLLHVDRDYSRKITDLISQGDLSKKPGWIRASIHPTMTDEDALYLGEKIVELSQNFAKWLNDYEVDSTHAVIKVKKSDCDKKMRDKVDNCLSKPLTV